MVDAEFDIKVGGDDTGVVGEVHSMVYSYSILIR
jgi:hypothetical protein